MKNTAGISIHCLEKPRYYMLRETYGTRSSDYSIAKEPKLKRLKKSRGTRTHT